MKFFAIMFSLLLSASVFADCRGKLMKQESFEASTPADIKKMLLNTKFTALRAAKDRIVVSQAVGEAVDTITNIKLVVYKYCLVKCYLDDESRRYDDTYVTSTITTTAGTVSEEDGPLGSERCIANHPLPRP